MVDTVVRAPITRHRVNAAALAVLALAAFAPRAAAKVPGHGDQDLPLARSSLGVADGELTTEVTYTGATATAAAACTGDSNGLERGLTFLLRTSVAYHLYDETPLSSCAERTVDTFEHRHRRHPCAPVTLARPTTQPWGSFTAYAEVLAFDGSSGRRHPRRRAAGQRRAASGLHRGTRRPFGNAINSGQPDSICTTIPVASMGSIPFAHGLVSRAGPNDLYAHEERLVAPIPDGRARQTLGRS